MRLFVGLPLPHDVRTALTAALQPVWRTSADVAWTRPGGWHVTVAYVGDTTATPDEVAAATAAGLDGVAPPRMDLGTVTWFDRAWVVEVVADPDGWCVDVGRRVQAELAGAGIPVVTRDVVAHVTLGRRRGRRGSPRAAAVDVTAPPLAGVPAWTADELVVFASETGDGPARYPVVASVSLG